MIIPIPIPIILFGFISNRYRYRYICLAPYQTDTDTDNRFKPILTDYLQVLLYISANFTDTDTYIHHTLPIPIILFGFISNQYRYRFVKPLTIPIICIGYPDLADYRSIPSQDQTKSDFKYLCTFY